MNDQTNQNEQNDQTNQNEQKNVSVQEQPAPKQPAPEQPARRIPPISNHSILIRKHRDLIKFTSVKQRESEAKQREIENTCFQLKMTLNDTQAKIAAIQKMDQALVEKRQQEMGRITALCEHCKCRFDDMNTEKQAFLTFLAQKKTCN